MKNKLYLGLLLLALAVGFTLRLYKITSPIADWHSWRQADTSAVTRNFVKYGVNVLYPRFDDFTDVSNKGLINTQGYRFVEFPIFNLIHFTLFKTIGVMSLEFWGRMTSVLGAIVSAVMIFFLVRRHASVFAGLVASILYLVLPFNIYFTRVVLPDPLMVTFFLTALNTFDLYFSTQSKKYFWLTALFGACAVLLKPIALFFLLPITFLFIKRYKFGVIKHLEFWLLHGLFFLPFGLWRLWSHRHPEGIPNSFWLINGTKIRFKGAFFQWIFGVRIGELILGKWGIWPLLVGAVNSTSYFVWIGLSSILYLFTFATGNVQHDYYQIPIIPSIAMIAAVGSEKIWFETRRRFVNRTALVICWGLALALAWYDIRGLYQINNYPIVVAGQAADRLLPADAIVLAPYGGDTAFLYQINRRGFPYTYMPVKDMIDRYGVKYYVSVNYDDQTNEMIKKYTVLEKNKDYIIIKLEEPLRP